MKEYAKCSECRKFPNVESELKKSGRQIISPNISVELVINANLGIFLL